MIYGSVCSGIEAATVAWHPLGWRAAFYSEIERFPSAVLNAYYPDVPNRGDMTKFKEWPDANLDVLVGGTPCQSFSVAGLRKGLDDPRGNLTLTYLAVADKHRPRWLVWENVPGVLSDATGAFGAFLCGLAKLGYGFAYRIFDAQYFRVAQQRRRVFVVGCLGDWRSAAAVLLELSSMRGDLAPSREAGKAVALPVTSRVDRGGQHREAHGNNLIAAPEIARCIATREGTSQDYETTTMVAHSLRARANASHREDSETYIPVAHSLRGEGFDASEDGTGRGTPLVPVAHVDVLPTMLNGANTPAGHNARSGHSKDSYVVPMAIDLRNGIMRGGATQTIQAAGLGSERGGNPNAMPATFDGMRVRRLTPRECERLQGFPDDYTLIDYKGKPAKDGPRYKALGNSMAVPVMRWLGERIAAVDQCSATPGERTV
jgi:DNA (cytosine-5)-methyltransferase 1